MTTRPRTRKTHTTTTVTDVRGLPEHVRLLGDVAIARPIRPGAIAHRYTTVTVVETVPAPTHIDPDRTVDERVPHVAAGCWTQSDETQLPPPYAALSAGYADATFRVTACPACFPEPDSPERSLP